MLFNPTCSIDKNFLHLSVTSVFSHEFIPVPRIRRSMNEGKVMNVKLNMCEHLINYLLRTNSLTSNLPSLKRAGAVLFREVLPVIVSFERVISTGQKP